MIEAQTMRVLHIVVGTLCVSLALLSAIHPGNADQAAERDFKLWYERAASGNVSAAADGPVRLYRWFNPLKVAAYLDDE